MSSGSVGNDNSTSGGTVDSGTSFGYSAFTLNGTSFGSGASSLMIALLSAASLPFASGGLSSRRNIAWVAGVNMSPRFAAARVLRTWAAIDFSAVTISAGFDFFSSSTGAAFSALSRSFTYSSTRALKSAMSPASEFVLVPFGIDCAWTGGEDGAG